MAAVTRAAPAAAGRRVGFLTQISRGDRHWGGLLVMDAFGDPVDFAYSDPVSLPVMTRLLFGQRLSGHLLAKTFAPVLLAALGRRPEVVCFEDPAVLGRRSALETPVAVLAPASVRAGDGWSRIDLPSPGRARGVWWLAGDPRAAEGELLQEVASGLGPLGLAEPFERLREALAHLRGD